VVEIVVEIVVNLHLEKIAVAMRNVCLLTETNLNN
jgi:hypothetical protein